MENNNINIEKISLRKKEIYNLLDEFQSLKENNKILKENVRGIKMKKREVKYINSKYRRIQKKNEHYRNKFIEMFGIQSDKSYIRKVKDMIKNNDISGEKNVGS